MAPARRGAGGGAGGRKRGRGGRAGAGGEGRRGGGAGRRGGQVERDSSGAGAPGRRPWLLAGTRLLDIEPGSWWRRFWDTCGSVITATVACVYPGAPLHCIQFVQSSSRAAAPPRSVALFRPSCLVNFRQQLQKSASCSLSILDRYAISFTFSGLRPVASRRIPSQPVSLD